MTAITLDLHSVVDLTDEQFSKLCQANPDIKLERTAKGELILMPPTGGETGDRNSEINFQLRAWNKQNLLGKVFDSSTGFKLPNGANRSPDASWVKLERWQALNPAQRQKFPPLAPDFVVELRSATDDLKLLQNKMQEYRDNGVRLGWLIDPQNQQVEIYRQGQDVEVVRTPSTLSGEDVLPEFVLNLQDIF
jgi:Uma2 family endonuclease